MVPHCVTVGKVTELGGVIMVASGGSRQKSHVHVRRLKVSRGGGAT